jgi:3-methylcrotonyl-CoA carboxylase beta subunit
LDDNKGRYEKQTTPYYAAARLWVDAVIDPVDTRMLITEALRASDHNPFIAEFKTGLIQV